MGTVHVRTAERLVRALGYGGNLTAGRRAEAFGVQEHHGFICAVDPREAGRRAHLAFVARHDSRWALVQRVRDGSRTLPTAEVEATIKAPINSQAGLDALSGVGICVTSVNNGTVKLQPANVDLARIVNRSQLRVGRKGWEARGVIAAALDRPRGSIKRLTDDLKLVAAERFQSLGVNASELLDGKRFVHLYPIPRNQTNGRS